MDANTEEFRALVRGRIAALGAKKYSIAREIGLSDYNFSHRLYGRIKFTREEALSLVRLLDELEQVTEDEHR